MFAFLKNLDTRSRKVLAACYFAFFVNGAMTLMMGSVMPDLKSAYGLTDTQSGIFLSAHSFGNMIAGFIGALVPLFLGERRSIMLLAGTIATGFIIISVTGSPVLLFIAFAFLGLGRGSVTAFDNRLVNRLTGGNASASNCLHAFFAVGAIFAPMLFLFLGRALTWRAPVLFLSMLSFAAVFGYSRMQLEEEYPDRKNKSNRSAAFLKNPSYLILAFMLFCYVCSEYAINGWLVTYIQNKEELLASFSDAAGGIDAAVKSYSQRMATLLWTVMLIGRLTCAELSTKIHQKKLILFCSFGVVLFFLMMLRASSIPMVTVSVAGLGLSMSGISPMIYADSAIFTNAYPFATSFLLIFSSVGSITMNSLVGALADRFGFHAGMSAILVTVVLLSVFSLLNVVVKTRKPKLEQSV